MKKKYIIIYILVVLIFAKPASATCGDPADWIDWLGPDYPPSGHCFNESGDYWLNHWFDNETPSNREEGVTITAKGVQTCIDLILPQGCTVNVTFQWLNWSLLFDDWVAWAYEQNWWYEDGINWSSEPDWNQPAYWFNYSNWTDLSVSQTLCDFNTNVSCHVENDWITEWFDWRVVANFTCGSSTYNTTCYYYFIAEDCSINYIYPASPNGTGICPCCSHICVNATNEEGHLMNLTFFRNDSMNETFYIINKYIYVNNGTYCFCIDGHVDDIYYPVKYNQTYRWYVNITDTVTGVQHNSNIFQFRTAEDPVLCPCGYNATLALIESTDKIQDDTWIVGLVIIFFVLALILSNKKTYIKKEYNKRRKK